MPTWAFKSLSEEGIKWITIYILGKMFFQGYLEKSGVFVGKVNKFPICILNFLVPRYPVKEEGKQYIIAAKWRFHIFCCHPERQPKRKVYWMSLKKIYLKLQNIIWRRNIFNAHIPWGIPKIEKIYFHTDWRCSKATSNLVWHSCFLLYQLLDFRR